MMIKKLKIESGNRLLLLTLRLALIFVILGFCRLLFYLFNLSLLEPVTFSALPSILRASFIFDSGSVFYANGLFIILSLLPFGFTEKKVWQKILIAVYLLFNGAALVIAVTDIFYFPYKLARIAGDDLHFFGESGIISILFSAMLEYWYGVILLGLILYYVLYWGGFRLISYKRVESKHSRLKYYAIHLLQLAAVAVFAIVAIRGYNISAASYPITVSDATKYVAPKYVNIVMSNPFAIVRTANHSLRAPNFTVQGEAYNPVRKVDASQYSSEGKNIVVIVLESFGSAFIKSVSEDYPKDMVSFTPFLDSLFNHGALFVNGYQSGIRSIDAMPAIWSSIPSLNQQFLSLPQSQGSYESLPHILKQMGYTTSFMHGAESSSMSFKAFGGMIGIDNYLFREDYEKINGGGDFDGKWGIWDHKFIPFALNGMNNMKKPFFNTIFTLSSHHPFKLPDGFEGKYAKGDSPLQPMMAYTDDALREFFAKAKQESWYDNTLFVITADHGAGALNDKWKGFPYTHRVPIFFYSPDGNIPSVRFDKTAAHIDIMPTILSLLGYEEEFFSFGTSLFANGSGLAIVGNNENYCVIEGENLYRFDNGDLLEATNIVTREKIITEPTKVDSLKSYINSYFNSIKTRKYSR